MNAEEAGKLVALMAMYDNRRVSDLDIVAWLKVIGDLPYADCEQAVIGHYADSTERLMPAHVRQRVKAMRRDRLDREIVPAPPAELADSPRNYRAALMARIRQIADGRTVRQAIGPGPREGDPPQEWADAKAALAADAPRPLTPQEKARQQAEESRNARKVTDGQEPAA